MKKTINKTRIFYIIMAVLIIILISVTGVKFIKEFGSKEKKEEVSSKNTLDTLEMYGYSLDDMDTLIYKNYFDELKEVLNKEEINYSDYASSSSKLFITDFYTLNNKATSSDIGGVEFVHPNILDNFKLNAGDTIYNHIKNNVYGDRTQELPVVSEVIVNSLEEVTYTYNNNQYPAYKVNLSWNYEKDLGYENSGILYLIKEDSKLYVVEKTGV